MIRQDMLPFIPSWLNQAGLSQAEFRVYCCLASRADKATGIAWPKAETIAKDCQMAKNTVWKSLRLLEDRQMIKRVGKPFQGSSRYQVLSPIGANQTPIENATGANGIPVEHSTSANQIPIELPIGANETPPIGANQILQSAQIDSRECNPKKDIQRREEEERLPFLSDAFRAAWDDWKLHRKEIKKPLTPTSKKQQLRNLEEMGEARSIAAIRHTIGNGWQGLREPEANARRGQAVAPEAVPAGTIISNGRAYKTT